ncbi:hypothetical protein AB7M49_005939 [Bradyrhizobium elkanii]|uniref:hypothetical protein n=1 Tax=Bradyrhizobium elkanii TaxID=29448 RepID=UPI00084127E5|nr:hypothetical protein [Bradyrhizobium elkanii]MCP1968285.1 hypothetical protein [Bradyrhizobium elkanii]MCS4110214.1 hypothetical protein [Bradyrhizobium elkanii]ODM84434.1 hypothetical protein A6452_17070 [Bradyrhizobium elkanii]ODM86384.1 hypothetical protein A6X20_01780 [Bradyrhizobium elkanii]
MVEHADRASAVSRQPALRGRRLPDLAQNDPRRFDSDFFWDQLRSRQERLLKLLRTERATGVYPGSA